MSVPEELLPSLGLCGTRHRCGVQTYSGKLLRWKIKISEASWEVVRMHTFNPNVRKAEAGRPLNLRPTRRAM